MTNQEQAHPLLLSLYSCSKVGDGQEDQGSDWVRRSYRCSFFSFIFYSELTVGREVLKEQERGVPEMARSPPLCFGKDELK